MHYLHLGRLADALCPFPTHSLHQSDTRAKRITRLNWVHIPRWRGLKERLSSCERASEMRKDIPWKPFPQRRLLKTPASGVEAITCLPKKFSARYSAYRLLIPSDRPPRAGSAVPKQIPAWKERKKWTVAARGERTGGAMRRISHIILLCALCVCANRRHGRFCECSPFTISYLFT